MTDADRTATKPRQKWFSRGTGLVVLLVLGVTAGCANNREMSSDEMHASRPALVETHDAIQAYYTDAGEYPASLGDLVPSYLADIPRDALGRDIEYRLYDDIDIGTPYIVWHEIKHCTSCSYSYHPSLGWYWECSGGGCDH